MSLAFASRMVGLAERRASWMAVRALLREWTGRTARERAAREAERAESEGVEEVRDMVDGCEFGCSRSVSVVG